MKKKIRLFSILATLLLVSSCGVNGSLNDSSSSAGTGGSSSGNSSCGECTGNADITLDNLNDYFANSDEWQDLAAQNKVTLIPFTHINGPRVEWDFFAIVNFEFDAGLYYKYQVSYLSCTCREPDVNYWQTMYVELTAPIISPSIEVQYISFDTDGTGHYIGGFWGDSGVNGYDINGNGMTYEGIKKGFLPYLVGKTKEEINQWSTYDDIDADDFNKEMGDVEIVKLGRTDNGDGTFTYFEKEPQKVTYDTFNGSSVSTNNIIRVLNSLLEYHAAKF